MMMNKSKIEWCDFTWNPVTGCRHGCTYCYAAKQASRFSGNVMINKASRQLRKEDGMWVLERPFRNEVGKVTPFPVKFEPMLHEYRLAMPAQKKKPALIFVVSMGDLFGEWMPESWIEKVFIAAQSAPWHKYLFLTKNPGRYIKLLESGKLPALENFWYGTTVTKPDQPYFHNKFYNTFLSIEPIHADFAQAQIEYKSDWVIVGAETGQQKDKIVPQAAWIQYIVDSYKECGTPVFLKNNLKPYWKGELYQESPFE